MKNIIVNIESKSDIYEKYNNGLSRDLINYLIKESKFAHDNIKITINTNLKLDNIDTFIKDGLKNAYNETRIIDRTHNIKQLLLLIIGTIFLIISTLTFNIIKEIIIIAGWVAIWEVVDISLNIDSELKLTRKIIKKLINCKIEVNEIK